MKIEADTSEFLCLAVSRRACLKIAVLTS